MLLQLGPTGRDTLLRIANTSWTHASVPGAWRVAEICALLKKGKDSHKAKSYRPVSLTSCIAKLVERLIAARLDYVIEKWEMLSHEQAGYRACRSTEEQLTLITQTIADAMEAQEYTLMLAIDFTQAFDRAKRTKFFKKALDKGFPPQVVRWLKA
eukprot:gene57165-biopygen65625